MKPNHAMQATTPRRAVESHLSFDCLFSCGAALSASCLILSFPIIRAACSSERIISSGICGTTAFPRA